MTTDELRELLLERAEDAATTDPLARLAAVRDRGRTVRRRRRVAVGAALVAAVVTAGVAVLDLGPSGSRTTAPVAPQPSPTQSLPDELARPDGMGLGGSPLADPLDGGTKIGEVRTTARAGVTGSTTATPTDLRLGWAVSCPDGADLRYTVLVNGNGVMSGDCSDAFTRSGLLQPDRSTPERAAAFWSEISVQVGVQATVGVRVDSGVEPVPAGDIWLALYDGAPFVRALSNPEQGMSVSGRLATVTDARPQVFMGFAEAPDGSGDSAVVVDAVRDEGWEDALVDAMGSHDGWQLVTAPLDVRELESLGRRIEALAAAGGLPTFEGVLVTGVAGTIGVYVSSDADRQAVTDLLTGVTVTDDALAQVPVLDAVRFRDP